MAILRFSLKIHILSRLPPVRENFSKIWEFLTLRPSRVTTFCDDFRFQILIQPFFQVSFKILFILEEIYFFAIDKESADVEHFLKLL